MTTSGVIAAALFGFATFSAGDTFVLPDDTHRPLLAALFCFAAASAAGLIVNLPLWYRDVDEDSLEAGIGGEADEEDEAYALRAIAYARLEQLRAARKANGRKGWFLWGGLLGESLGVLFITYAVYLTVTAP